MLVVFSSSSILIEVSTRSAFVVRVVDLVFLQLSSLVKVRLEKRGERNRRVLSYDECPDEIWQWRFHFFSGSHSHECLLLDHARAFSYFITRTTISIQCGKIYQQKSSSAFLNMLLTRLASSRTNEFARAGLLRARQKLQ